MVNNKGEFIVPPPNYLPIISSDENPVTLCEYLDLENTNTPIDVVDQIIVSGGCIIIQLKY